jgi:hypothetical protein
VTSFFDATYSRSFAPEGALSFADASLNTSETDPVFQHGDTPFLLHDHVCGRSCARALARQPRKKNSTPETAKAAEVSNLGGFLRQICLEIRL